MPFFDDAGIVRENHRGPVIGALAVFGEQVERMVGLSIAWSATLLPAMVALAYPTLPMWLRAGMTVLSSLAVVPATGMLYSLAAQAIDGEEIGTAAALAAFRATAVAAMRTLVPLFAMLFVIGWTAVVAGSLDLIGVQVVLQVCLLLLLVCAAYWGPLLASGSSALGMLRRSALLVWRYPAVTLKVTIATVVIGLIGVVTLAGALLAVPAVVALMQINLLRQVMGAENG